MSRARVIYTLHFARPLAHARHYTGSTPSDRLDTRLAEHRAGRGARLMEVLKERGIDWQLAKVEPGDRTKERQLKQHSATRRCPVCQEETDMQKNPIVEHLDPAETAVFLAQMTAGYSQAHEVAQETGYNSPEGHLAAELGNVVRSEVDAARSIGIPAPQAKREHSLADAMKAEKDGTISREHLAEIVRGLEVIAPQAEIDEPEYDADLEMGA